MSSPEDFQPVYQDVGAWLREARGWWGPSPPEYYLGPLPVYDVVSPYWDPFLFYSDYAERRGLGGYQISKKNFNYFIDAINHFVYGIDDWIGVKWSGLGTWIAGINAWIESLWNNILAGMASLATTIKDEIVGLANFVSNIYTWVVWNLVDDVTRFVSNLFRPLTDAWAAVTGALSAWGQFIYEAITGFLADPVGWIQTMIADFGTWIGSVADMIWDSIISLGDTIGAYIGTKLSAFAPLVVEYLRDALVYVWGTVIGGTTAIKEVIQDAFLFIWDALKVAWIFVVDDIIPAVQAATSGALGWLKDEFSNLLGLLYDELMQKARSFVPMTPEKAPELALAMFGSAVGFGALAHGMALAVEAVPNLKWLGTHYFSAFVAQMGGFSAISGSTMGVMAALALRTPFTYYLQNLLRPILPDSISLQIMAVKPDIPMETFRQQMAYQGYSDYWIDAFQRTMFKEPKYFELSMMGEDEAATPEWLFLKARRCGYNEEDAVIFVSSLLKKATRSQRLDLYKNAFYAFKEGYINEHQFNDYLDAMEMRQEGKVFAAKAALLAYETDLLKEWIAIYRTAYKDDLITEQECRVSIAALGLPSERVNAIVELEWTKKQPKILKAERKEIEDAWREIQREYITLYIETFRRYLITEAQLAANLTAIGMEARAATANARLEAIKLVPKIKPAVIEIPVIPVPLTPPRLE